MFHVLIETLWNVKIENYDRMEDWTGINRNIVECKVKNNIVKYRCQIVLIETLWNVKLLKGVIEPVIGEQVLIETLWNVKEGDTTKEGMQKRINRNIVECKAFFAPSTARYFVGINRNIVECKVRSPGKTQGDARCINRNIVECKDSCMALLCAAS